MQKIGFKKSEKTSVVRWIERQFKEKPAFPGSDKDLHANKTDEEGYRQAALTAWQGVPLKRRLIVEWIEKWMSQKEKRKLCRYLDTLENKGEKSSDSQTAK